MEDICGKLDQILEEYLNLISEYQGQWKQYSKEAESGFFQLAHSKYIMGHSRLSQDQYDGRMQANTQVLISPNTDSKTNKDSWIQFTLMSGHLDDSMNAENNMSSSSLRRRATHEFEKKEKSDMENNEKPLIKRRTTDPLNWFGVLVPPSLRESQRHFKQGLTSIINIINLRNEIINKEAEYQVLKKEKKKLIEINKKEQELKKEKEKLIEINKKEQELKKEKEKLIETNKKELDDNNIK
ncbi:6976_t:CDS:2 [Diversispora eburnea]|uniref:Vacuolar ATPase assembly protein VMA22 n=1 Tax=Diversispora eburnea TaxID=1213867 RepID=A0A9N8V7R9_9GLOM|nr:6976_t:CDS:2 [Diversispora eburnea]